MYDMVSHSYIRRNRVPFDKTRINPQSDVFTFRTYKTFLRQQKMDYIKKKKYGFVRPKASFSTPGFLNVREHFFFATVLRGLVLPFWLRSVRSSTYQRCWRTALIPSVLFYKQSVGFSSSNTLTASIFNLTRLCSFLYPSLRVFSKQCKSLTNIGRASRGLLSSAYTLVRVLTVLLLLLQ